MARCPGRARPTLCRPVERQRCQHCETAEAAAPGDLYLATALFSHTSAGPQACCVLGHRPDPRLQPQWGGRLGWAIKPAGSLLRSKPRRMRLARSWPFCVRAGAGVRRFGTDLAGPFTAEAACGVDEAGRGAVLGPLVTAGVTLTREGQEHLWSLGVRDSKTVSPARRKLLYPLILETAEAVATVHISALEIDRRAGGNENLNAMEFEAMLHVCSMLTGSADHFVLDSYDPTPARLSGRIAEALQARSTASPVVHAEHGADTRFVVAAAASIVAKYERDSAWARLQGEAGIEAGTGYPSDPRTKAWLETYFAEDAHRAAPPHFARAMWQTLRRLGVTFPRADPTSV